MYSYTILQEYICFDFHCYYTTIGKREIRALQIYCENRNRKCDWVGNVGELETHLTTCEFVLFPCPKECNDEKNEVKIFMRKDLDSHLERDCPNRDYTCEYCGEKGTYASITEIHDKICQKKLIGCSNEDCLQTMQRQSLKRHLDNCEHTVVPCKYRKLGCPESMKRKEMPPDHPIGPPVVADSLISASGSQSSSFNIALFAENGNLFTTTPLLDMQAS